MAILATLGRVAGGIVYGIDKGADTFNKGIGAYDMEVPKGSNDILGIRGNMGNVGTLQGNNDLLDIAFPKRTNSTSKKRKKQKQEQEDEYDLFPF